MQSVNNAEQWKRKHRNRVIGMPPREKIFLTSGPWEDYSTPSRDMRLLIAMDAVLKFPQRLVNVPERFILPPGKSPIQMRDEMAGLLRQVAQQREFTYTRSDGTRWQLSIADVLDRAVAFEMAYNPNDCPEVRWAAPEGTEERRPCNVRAPSDHFDAMTTYRSWFATRVRPGQ